MKFCVYKWMLLLLTAFLLNLAWEYAHHGLYTHHEGAAIMDFILFRAAVFDTLFILAAAFLYERAPHAFRYWWVLAGALVVFAIGLEWWALATERWAYGPAMPILPVVRTGLTPTVQLALTGLAALFLARRVV